MAVMICLNSKYKSSRFQEKQTLNVIYNLIAKLVTLMLNNTRNANIVVGGFSC